MKDIRPIILRFITYAAVFYGLSFLPVQYAAIVTLTIFICKLDEIKNRL